DHDVSSGAVRVVQGALHESNPRIGGDHLTVRVRDGESFSFGPEHIHRLGGAVGGAVSIHAYSPPLCRMGQYEFTVDGLMRRVSIDYADELRAGAVCPPPCPRSTRSRFHCTDTAYPAHTSTPSRGNDCRAWCPTAA